MHIIEGEYDDRTGVLSLKCAENITAEINDNLMAQQDPNNGFSAGRTMRRVASIPISVFRSWQIEFERMGGKNQLHWTDDWRKFREKKLADHPEYRTVDKMLHVTPNSGNIIIK